MSDALPFCPNPYHYHRRPTREVRVGKVGVGGDNPVRVQSMLTSSTLDTEACIAETLGLVAVGCEIVRITAQTVRHAANLEHIKAGLLAHGCDVPLVADIHFKPDAALEAAKWVEKVRVNPGNYADSKKFAVREYTDAQYEEEIERIREQFAPLVGLCQERGVAMRIGTNHGSLSDRIMNRYGDTPLGMVESALEFAHIARDMGYHAFVFSMKASNPKVMIEAYRLLAARLADLGDEWNYPIHLGVTEAGDGEDGRIKSAVGIGSLLADGIGDTIRVSLTEDSVYEIPVAQKLVAIQESWGDGRGVETNLTKAPFDPYDYVRRPTEEMEIQGIPLGGEQTIRVFTHRRKWDAVAHKLAQLGDFQPEIVVEDAPVREVDPRDGGEIALWNESDPPQLVTVRDGLDLPVIAAFRLLAAQLDPRHSILLKDTLQSGIGVPPMTVPTASRRPAEARPPIHYPALDEDLVIRQGGNLPHWEEPGAAYAVTFRLADSLPAAVLDAYLAEKGRIEARVARLSAECSANTDERARREAVREITALRAQGRNLYHGVVEPALDHGHGACWMARNEAVAELVADALRHFDGERYDLHAFAVMPNHVHVVLGLREGHRLGDVLHSIKSFTAKKANAALGRSGKFWQKESYDHLVRDEVDFANQVAYVLENPAQAGLRDWRWVGGCAEGSPEAGRLGHGHRRDADATVDFVTTLLTASRNLGSLLCDGIGDAILIQGEEAPGQSLRLAYNVLQGAGARIFKTDYVACPSCGRTLFNLQETTAKIRAATGHLKGVRIAIMGCIVNGPGEMADADFGYVGGAPSKINLYVGKTPVKFNIPQEEAVERLVDLIREHGKWVEAPAPVKAV